MSMDMYKLCIQLSPSMLTVHVKYCQQDIQLLERFQFIIFQYLMLEMSEDVNQFNYCPLIIYGRSLVTNHRILLNIVQSIDPRVHWYYKSQIIADQGLLVACNRISWIRKYYHSAQYYRHVRDVAVQNNHEVIQFLINVGR